MSSQVLAHRKSIRIVAYAVGLLAVVMALFSISGATGLPLIIPLLLMLSAAGLFMASAPHHAPPRRR